MAAWSPTHQVPASLGNATRCFLPGRPWHFYGMSGPLETRHNVSGDNERGPCVPPTSAPTAQAPAPRSRRQVRPMDPSLKDPSLRDPGLRGAQPRGTLASGPRPAMSWQRAQVARR